MYTRTDKVTHATTTTPLTFKKVSLKGENVAWSQTNKNGTFNRI